MKLIYQTALFAAALTAASCSQEKPFDGPDSGSGTLILPGVEVNNAAQVVDKAPSMGSRATYDVDGFIVDFYRSGEADPFRTKTYAEINGAEELPVGTYTLKVRSHDVQVAEWDNPYFAGETQEFTIEDGKITELDPVVCKFSSIKVSVVFGPKLKEKLGADAKVEVKASTDGKLVYTPSETRDGYFSAVEGSTTLTAVFTGTISGREETITRTYADVQAGQHRIITYEMGGQLPVPPSPSGSVDDSQITIDVTMTEVDLNAAVDPGKEDVLPGEDEPGTLPGVDDPDPENPDDPNKPENPDDPTSPISFSGNLSNGGTYTSDEFINSATGEVIKAANVVISVEKGCKDIHVVIDSSFLSPEELEGNGLAGEFNLVENTDKIYNGLAGLCLPCRDGGTNEDGKPFAAVRNQTSINFDISDFMALLEIGGTSTSTFKLLVTDNEGNTAPYEFTINVK